MAPLDRILFISFSTLALGGLLASVLCIRMAMRVASRPDSEFSMFLWAAGAMIGLIVAGVSTAYILLPILFSL